MNSEPLWNRFQRYYQVFPKLGLSLDISRMNFASSFFDEMERSMQTAFQKMEALEKGAIANPDENRMVGHYWLRNPERSPDSEITEAIAKTQKDILQFCKEIHDEKSVSNVFFKNYLLIGIGGSALGPQFVAHALGQPGKDPIKPYFFDNTDPDGMQRVLAEIGEELDRTLVVVVSKSGGTKETRNGMLVAEQAFQDRGLDFEKHAVAITGAGSELDRYAKEKGWLKTFPMWDWVGGRTSETSAVGLLPAALQGFDIDALLEGARQCDEVTRRSQTLENPAALLALMWYYIGNGKGAKDMVILPYKDRLELFSKYLQQLIMESLGKELDLNGKEVHQGLSVFGNKGSTDQHAYIQQLREGLPNFFVTFIEVLKDQEGAPVQVEDQTTPGDYLHGFFLGTREALYEKGRESITLTVEEVNAFTVGVLIALYERAVGLYAELIRVNAYHQPGVEAGKKAAGGVINLQKEILRFLQSSEGPQSIDQIAQGIGAAGKEETIFKLCRHLAANASKGVEEIQGQTPFEARYQCS